MSAMTYQAIFDATCEHLAKQKHRSMMITPETGNKSTCAYRGDNGDKCAYGLFIPDEEYNRSTMESQTCSTLALHGYIAPAFRGEDPLMWESKRHQILAIELQIAHDKAYHVDDLREFLSNAAKMSSASPDDNINTDKVELITEWSK